MQQYFTSLSDFRKATITSLYPWIAILAIVSMGKNVFGQSYPTDLNLSDTLYCEDIGGLVGDAAEVFVRDTISGWYRVVDDSLKIAGDCDSVSVAPNPDGTFFTGTDIDSAYCFVWEVTWTVIDTSITGCAGGDTTVFNFSFVILDTLGPVFTGVPADTTVNIEDFSSIPAPPVVTAADDCSDVIVGNVQFSADTTVGSTCDSLFIITRTWTAEDSCGNISIATQIINVLDSTPPSFDSTELAGIDTIAFDNQSNTIGLSIPDTLDKYRPTIFTDNSGGTPTIIDFVDTNIPGTCDQNFEFTRQWILADSCDNRDTFLQRIIVVDSIPPTATFPADTTVSCEVLSTLNFLNSGTPVDILDAAVDTTGIAVSFDDSLIGVTIGCPSQDTFQVVWTVSDACGNAIVDTQIVSTLDTTPPTFDVLPSDSTIIQCLTTTDINQAFDDYIASLEGLSASDNCSSQVTVTVENVGGGAPSLTSVCPSPNNVVDSTSLIVTATDSCGNSTSVTTIFKVIDEIAPQFLSPASSFDDQISTDPGVCFAEVTLPNPGIQDNCTIDLEEITFSIISQTLTGPGTFDGVIDDFSLTFDLSTLSQPIEAESVTLTYTFTDIDANDVTEVFDVFGPGNVFLGITENSSVTCGVATGSITIPAAQFNAWAAQGPVPSLELDFRPREVAGDGDINNNVCTPTVDADLEVVNKTDSKLVFEYSLRGGPRVTVPIADIPTTPIILEEGENEISYFLIDCAGNESSAYTFNIEVVDEEDPILICNSLDTTLQLTLDNDCLFQDFGLPLPTQVSDNCPADSFTFNQIQPSINGLGQQLDTTAAYLRFFESIDFGVFKNIDSYNITFTNLDANALDSVSIQVKYRADIGDQDYLVTLSGSGAPIQKDLTGLLVSDCSNERTATVKISATEYNILAAGGTITATISPTPTVQNIGTTVCSLDTVYQDGDRFLDSISYFAINLSYTNWAPDYSASGATTFTGKFENTGVSPLETFELGQTLVTYSVTDDAGNTAECSYTVTVEDNTAPTVEAQPSVNIALNPGIADLTLDPADFDNGSFDNCTAQGDLTFSLSPSSLNCSLVSGGPTSTTVTLTVTDEAGLSSSTDVTVNLESLFPQPSFFQDVCEGDTLFLFANPPTDPINGQVPSFSSFTWTRNTDGLILNEENPIIISPEASDAGFYTVTIQGNGTGCSAQAQIEVDIEEEIVPVVTSATGSSQFCVGDAITFNSSIPAGANRQFEWYIGSTLGSPIQTTTQPSFTLTGFPAGDYDLFLIVAEDDCDSQPSAPFGFTINEIPVASVSDNTIEVCEGDNIILQSTSPGGVTHSWTGPNGFTSDQRNPPAIIASSVTTSSDYFLTVSQNGCESTTIAVVVDLDPSPPTPSIAGLPSAIVCEGEPLTLTATSGASEYIWTSPQLAEQTTNVPTLSLGNASFSMNGTWRVRSRIGECFSDDSAPLTVVVNPIPTATAGAVATTVCENSSIQLIASPTVSGAIYNWTGPAGVSIPSGQNPVISNVQESFEGTYQLEYIAPTGCSSTDDIDIDVTEAVTITDIIVNAPTCSQGPATVTLTPVLSENDPGTFQYSWSGINGFTSIQPVATLTNATILASGPYTLQITDDNGCQSNTFQEVVSLTFAPAAPAVPLPPPGFDVQYCVGETIELITASTYSGQNIEYSWFTPRNGGTPIVTPGPTLTLNDATLADNGLYSVFVTVDGCTSVISGSINLTVSEEPVVVATNNGPVCEGTELILTGSEVPGATYNWQGPGFNSTQRVAVIPAANANLNEGTYELTINLNGCTSVGTTVVDVLDVPESPSISANGPICVPKSTKTLQLSVDSASAEPGATYIWQGPAGILDTTTSLVDTIGTSRLPTQEGVYEFSLVAISADGCPTAPEIVEVGINTVPDQEAFAGLDSAYCEGSLIRLNADAPSVGIGTWSELDPVNNPEVDITDPTNPKSSIGGLLPGKSYTFRWSLSNGACQDYDQQDVNITVNADVPLNAGEDQFFCQGEIVQLNGLDPGEGQPFWTQPLTQQELGITILDVNEPGTVVENLIAGNVYEFTLNLETACGIVTDEVLVTVFDNAPFAGADFEACTQDQSAQLSAVEPQGGSSGRWSSLDPEIRFSDVTSPISSAFNLELGSNTLIWELDNGNCGEASRDTVVVTMRQSPVANGDEVSVDFLRSVQFSPLANDAIPAEGATISIVNTPESGVVEVIGDSIVYLHTDPRIGTDQFTYQITSLNCPPSEATVIVNIGENVTNSEDNCFVPSIITPNGDGYNDEFLIPCLSPGGEVVARLAVFNRWGDEVFSSDDYQNDWEGTFNGQDVPDGVYFYRIEFEDPDEPVQAGYIYIKR